MEHNIEIGMAVQWKEDNKYKGICWEINEKENMAYVEFLYPSCFTQSIALDEIEPSGTNPITQAISDKTRLNAKQVEELRIMFIDLALQTKDQDWFNKLMDGSWVHEL